MYKREILDTNLRVRSDTDNVYLEAETDEVEGEKLDEPRRVEVARVPKRQLLGIGRGAALDVTVADVVAALDPEAEEEGDDAD